MKTLHFETMIEASPEKVWDTMLGRETYPRWVDVAWPGSTYHGEWKQGTQIRFTGAESGGGTLGEVIELDPYKKVAVRHIAVLLDDGREDCDSDMAKSWIGSTEVYTFTPQNGSTKLEVELSVPPDWVDEFESGWSKAIVAVKELAQQ